MEHVSICFQSLLVFFEICGAKILWVLVLQNLEDYDSFFMPKHSSESLYCWEAEGLHGEMHISLMINIGDMYSYVKLIVTNLYFYFLCCHVWVGFC